MLFFGKKKEQKPVPPEEVQRMMRLGMSDKDIVKNLKAQGYAFSDIEKAMMSAVKKGVDEPAQAQMPGQVPAPMPGQQLQMPAQQQLQMPALPELPPGPTLEEELGLGGEEEFEINPDLVVEELVEGVVEEKWKAFEERIVHVEDELNKIHDEINASLQKLGDVKNDPHGRETDARLQELTEQYEELQARVGGLEKAFKQFLPALTKNIESLSQMIHEMKEKRGVVEA